jgi:thiamine-monophosphate kinase
MTIYILIMPSILGKEFQFIKNLRKKGFSFIGDDCAILKKNKTNMVISTDSFVEDIHFSKKYFNLKEIGIKSFEAAVSDIAAMGAKPKYALVAISLNDFKDIKKIYKGILERSKNHKIKIIGGDISKSKKIYINISAIGETKKPIKRSGAKENDLVYISHQTGLSSIGFKFLKKNPSLDNIFTKAHKKPRAKVQEAQKLARYANAMIDTSDSLLSELIHLSKESSVCIKIDKIPISMDILRLKNKIKIKDYVLNGGEDFSLLYTIPKKYEKHAIGFKIGKVEKGSNVYINNKKVRILKNFKHFN